jgi:RimJ/RimL family protein N-acetyltransferase
MDKATVVEKINSLKKLPFRVPKMESDFGGLSYRLLFLTADRANDDGIIERLANWRRENEDFFASTFKVTFEGTKKWYRDKLINELDRLLFMIEVGDEYIGHIGLYRFNFDRDMCEIDNIIRGVQGYPGIMGAAIAEMMRWGQATLGLKAYSLGTTTFSVRALKMYQQLGFVEVKREPLVQIRNGQFLEWIVPDQNKQYDVLATRENIYMESVYAGK